MPAVREPSGDAPVKLEIVEVRPGVRLKLRPADKEAILGHQAAAAEAERVWKVGDAPAEKPTKAKGSKTAKSEPAKADDDAAEEPGE